MLAAVSSTTRARYRLRRGSVELQGDDLYAAMDISSYEHFGYAYGHDRGGWCTA